MLPLLILPALFGWWLVWGASTGWAAILTLATCALCYTVMGLAVYWTGILVYGWTHEEAWREAIRWHLHKGD